MAKGEVQHWALDAHAEEGTRWIRGWAYQQTIENDVEDEHPQVLVGHVKTRPQPHQGDEQEQEEHQGHLCREWLETIGWGRKEGYQCITSL